MHKKNTSREKKRITRQINAIVTYTLWMLGVVYSFTVYFDTKYKYRVNKGRLLGYQVGMGLNWANYVGPTWAACGLTGHGLEVG